jgi:hypothetical protein
MNIKTIICPIAFLLYSNSACAKPLNMHLEELVEWADSICEVRIDKSRKNNYIVTSGICLKGTPPKIIVTGVTSEDPMLKKDINYLVFLENCEGFSTPINGIVGAVQFNLSGDFVTYYIAGEDEITSRVVLFNNILKIIAKTSGVYKKDINYCRYVNKKNR